VDRALTDAHAATLGGMSADAPDRYGWESWRWDDSVFRGTAAYYRTGRYPYAPGLAEALGLRLALDGSGRLLDVGCGPGTVALAFAHLFEAGVGLDPDPDMLAEAEGAAAEMAIHTASWAHLRAESLPAALGTFRVVTFAQSFHWMDRPRVAAAVRQMLEPRGVVVLVDRAGPGLGGEWPDDVLPPVPEEVIDELRIRWLGPDRRAGHGFRNTSPSGEDEVFGAAGFGPEDTLVVPDGRAIHPTIDQVVARVFSSSWTAPHLFGARAPEFEQQLRLLLRNASPDGRFTVWLPDNRLRIWPPRP
jgi:SAM-dependent methyltransferase